MEVSLYELHSNLTSSLYNFYFHFSVIRLSPLGLRSNSRFRSLQVRGELALASTYTASAHGHVKGILQVMHRGRMEIAEQTKLPQQGTNASSQAQANSSPQLGHYR